MINSKFQATVFSFFMAFLMSSVMSMIIGILNVGLSEDIVRVWLEGWAYSFVISFPVLLLISPLVKLMTNWVCPST